MQGVRDSNPTSSTNKVPDNGTIPARGSDSKIAELVLS
jgi:hypothetical protein